VIVCGGDYSGVGVGEGGGGGIVAVVVVLMEVVGGDDREMVAVWRQ
jgi:hypothetical protein